MSNNFFTFLVATLTLYSTTAKTVADSFKAPNNNTPDKIRQQWKEQDEALWNYVEQNVPAVLNHTGSAAFDVHLKGVQAVLRYWGSPDYLANAGLFHSIYGTEGFQGFSLPLSERGAIQKLIGTKAERLSFLFCMIDRSTLDRTVFDWKTPVSEDAIFDMSARPELGRFSITMSKREWLDFVELTLADWLEQVEGAALKPSSLYLWKTGEAFAYRRQAYHKMSAILSQERPERLKDIPQAMVAAVYGTERTDTRHLVQPRTPPVSDAAAKAYAALRAVGEVIPENMAPQLLEECESA